jgi:hypothetical protein
MSESQEGVPGTQAPTKAGVTVDNGILLRWTCVTCGLSQVIPAPGFLGTGYRHFGPDNQAEGCGPLVAARVGGWLRMHPGASDEDIVAALAAEAQASDARGRA